MIFSPKVDWYVGMSGMLHGLLALGIIDGLDRNRWPTCIAGLLLFGKLLSESISGPNPATERIIGTAVVTASHLYGVLSGIVTAIVLRLRRNSPEWTSAWKARNNWNLEHLLGLPIFPKRAVPDARPDSGDPESRTDGNPSSGNDPDPRQGAGKILVQQIEGTDTGKRRQRHRIA